MESWNSQGDKSHNPCSNPDRSQWWVQAWHRQAERWGPSHGREDYLTTWLWLDDYWMIIGEPIIWLYTSRNVIIDNQQSIIYDLSHLIHGRLIIRIKTSYFMIFLSFPTMMFFMNQMIQLWFHESGIPTSRTMAKPNPTIRKLLSSCSPFWDSKRHMYIFRGFMISHDILYFYIFLVYDIICIHVLQYRYII